ncbi:hypothetical protein MBCUT_18450 [Methanobrevibacter cuticularis]|uniref:PepSY domain-containing protein n=1 Tax=Methanobrevibacter cuticularis TaxID=47311 RepID=A0A166CVV2_9EURY|nr:hypothetical protein [Methanobrevibacter cuticularis]KZX14918.1 hypothetical protein MBCUT_18450 [Methanobrevibacter cuticularis]
MEKNKIYLIILFVTIVLLFAFIFSIENNNKQENEKNQSILNNKLNDSINNNLTNDSNKALNNGSIGKNNIINEKSDSIKNNKINKNQDTFKIPKNARLSLTQVQKIADRGAVKGEYAKVLGTFKHDGQIFWNVIIYDKKTGKQKRSFVVNDKYGSQELM